MTFKSRYLPDRKKTDIMKRWKQGRDGGKDREGEEERDLTSNCIEMTFGAVAVGQITEF